MKSTKKRILKDPAGLWDKASMQDRMLWLLKSKVHESKLVKCMKMQWVDLPFEVQVEIGVMG